MKVSHGTIVSTVIFLLTLLVIVILVRTYATGPRSLIAPKCSPLDVDFIKASREVIHRFQEAVRFQTVSRDVGDQNYDEIAKFVSFIQKAYPALHSHQLVTYEIVNQYSLLYKVQGSNKSLKPYMLAAHLDVVPVETQVWDYPQFKAHIEDGFIYGRGTIDNKQSVMGILEAVTFMLKSGHKPARTFYIGFGHDEEVLGISGAKVINEILEGKGVKLEYLLDEGYVILRDVYPGVKKPVATGVALEYLLDEGHVITDGVYPGLKRPVATIGTSEKGSMTIQLTVNVTPGHSSMPEKESSIGILANAVSRLEANPHPSMFGSGPERGTFEHLAPEMNTLHRILCSNLWLFKHLISRILSGKPEANALLRTTTAVTMFNAGIKHNVIAATASAVVNHRVHPSQSLEEVLEFDKNVVGDDRVKFEVLASTPPHPLSPYGESVFGYNAVKTSLRQVWADDDLVVVPGLLTGNTDTRHYLNLTENIYRFSPTYMFPTDLKRFHGANERISIDNYEKAINFYYHIIMNSDKEKVDPIHTHGDDL